MEKEICNKIEKLFKDLYKGMFYVANYGYYLWVFENQGDRKIIVVHGYGTEEEPFEVKLLSIDEKKTVDKQFLSENEMIDYLACNLLDDMMVYGI
jgi:hypothetical protein